MKTRYYITETYCCGNLGTGYAVKTEAEALAILEQVKAHNEPNAYIKIEEQKIKWYQKYWRPVRVVAEWWN
jgi:hypothetical protein